jgi:NADH-quinone oxidoreductase subunit N
MLNLSLLIPEIIVLITALVVLIIDLLPWQGRKVLLMVAGILGTLGALIATLYQWDIQKEAFYGLVVTDNFSVYFKTLFLLICGLTILLSFNYITRGGMDLGEYYSLILLATFGYMFMASGIDLITIFLALEILSLAVYILAGFMRHNLKSNESAFKYFLLGAFSSAFLLYGIANIYGVVGNTNLKGIAQYFLQEGALKNPLFLGGMGLLLVGFGFKVAVVPFHMWTPDVYEGSPTTVTAFMAVGTKAASFAAFLRVFFYALEPLKAEWTPVLWILAAATIIFGNTAAIYQKNIKRMLAYSAIAHAGYILVAMVAGNALGSSSILYYLTVYSFMNLGAFGVVIIAEQREEKNLNITDYRGMAYSHPLLAATMSLFLFSLAGIPPTGGFVGKFYIFSAAVSAGYIGLAIIGVLGSAVAIYYYLRIIVYMYMYEPEKDLLEGRIPFFSAAALVIAALGIIQLGISPAQVLGLAHYSITYLVP